MDDAAKDRSQMRLARFLEAVGEDATRHAVLAQRRARGLRCFSVGLLALFVDLAGGQNRWDPILGKVRPV